MSFAQGQGPSVSRGGCRRKLAEVHLLTAAQISPPMSFAILTHDVDGGLEKRVEGSHRSEEVRSRCSSQLTVVTSVQYRL